MNYLGQVELFAKAPDGWAPCDGRLLAVQEQPELFSVIGNRYGGDGGSRFALPKIASLGPKGPHYFICLAGALP